MTMTTLIDQARALGGNSADAYSEEFDASPREDGVESVGDWDASAWAIHWHELKDSGATDVDYDACLAAWRAGFWGTPTEKTPADQIVELITRTLEEAATKARDAEIDAASPRGQDAVLRVIDGWRGYDNGVVFGTFSAALATLEEYREVPTGCAGHDPDDGDGREHLIEALATAGTIGAGEPLAYVGADGYFTLIRGGATRAEVECAALGCLPVGGEEF